MSKNIKTVSTQDFGDAGATVAKYIDGLRVGNIVSLTQAFHKNAVMYGLTNGELIGRPIKNLYDFVGKNGSAPDIKTRIDVLAITPTTAVVRVEMENDAIGADYTDFHTLIKLDGIWHIIAKVYHMYEKLNYQDADSEKKLGIPLSVLDLIMVNVDGSPSQSMQNSLDLARHAERWGYKRYWLAEHHNIKGIASTATAVLIGFIAGGTSTIRVGSGGVMLPNHAPLIIAEQFGTLESLYPGRIDLGLGRAPGTDLVTAMALRRNLAGSEEDDFPNSVMELKSYFDQTKPERQVRATPGEGLKVIIWLLGSSLFSSQLAAMLGLPYAFASHFAPTYLDAAVAVYRERFQPSETLKKPYVIAAVNVVAADTDKEANRLFTSLQLRTLEMFRGKQTPLQFPVNDIDSVWSQKEKHAVDQRLNYSFVGGPATVKMNLQSFLDLTKIDEVMAVSHIYEHSARLRSYEILSYL